MTRLSPLVPNWDLLAPLPNSIDIGIDEVGRGAWAGPVVAAAVWLRYADPIDGVGDSKGIPLGRRLILDRIIRSRALGIGIGWVQPAEIDEHGLSWAVRMSGLRALAGIDQVPTRVILDGVINYLAPDYPSQVFIRADALITPVAAASIIAKVARDRYMSQYAHRYSQYGFDHHVGYGTALHRANLSRFGISPLHRLSVKPVRQVAANTD